MRVGDRRVRRRATGGRARGEGDEGAEGEGERGELHDDDEGVKDFEL